MRARVSIQAPTRFSLRSAILIMLLSAGVLASVSNAAAPPQRPDRASAGGKAEKLPTRLEIEDGVLVIFDIAAYTDPAHDIKGYLVYWDDYAAEQLFVFGRLAEGPVDVGQAVLNLEIDLGIDSALLATQHWVLRKAVVDALRAQADAAEWAPATRGAILGLLGCPVPEGAQDEPAIGCAFWQCFVTAPHDPDGPHGDSNDKGGPDEPGGMDAVDASLRSPLREITEVRRCRALEASLNIACGCGGGGGGGGGSCSNPCQGNCCISTHICCSDGCCGGVQCCSGIVRCCPASGFCCENKRCCNDGETCCPGGENAHCCPSGSPKCCGDTGCCRDDRECCEGVCCGAGSHGGRAQMLSW